jgi:hypothetical protein
MRINHSWTPVIARPTPRQSALSWPRRAIGAIGAATIRSTHELLLSAALAATVLFVAARRSAWRHRVDRAEADIA